MEKEYLNLKYSKNSYDRLKSLITILKEDFDCGMLYISTDKQSAINQAITVINDIFNHIKWLNHIHENEEIFHLCDMNQYTNTDDNFYKHLIDFGGFNQVLVQANEILNASIILLDNTNENHLIICYNEKQTNDVYDLILDIFKEIQYTYCIEENNDFNQIIDNFLNKIDIDYDSMMTEMVK